MNQSHHTRKVPREVLPGTQRSQYPLLRHYPPARNKEALRKGADPQEMQLQTQKEYHQASVVLYLSQISDTYIDV